MTALLFFVLNNKSSAGNADNELNNPNQLFQYGSFYSVIWYVLVLSLILY